MKVCWLEVDWRVIQGSAGSGAFLRGKVWETFGGGRLKRGGRIPWRPSPPYFILVQGPGLPQGPELPSTHTLLMLCPLSP